jgi:hypothetical protein
MWIENLVFDAVAPRRLGMFWTDALGLEPLTDNAHGYEARLTVPDGPTLDLGFQPVAEPATTEPRLHLDLYGGSDQQEVVDRLVELGAQHLDIGQGDVPWTVLADVEGNAFCVMDEREAYRDTGPIAAIPIDSADPESDLAFWSKLSGWIPVAGVGSSALRHPSRRGPLLEFCPEPSPKTQTKNRLHIDLRLDNGDDEEAVVRTVQELGGRELGLDWGDLPWRVFADPSGNEFCILPQRR